jgi:hypothetical protein
MLKMEFAKTSLLGAAVAAVAVALFAAHSASAATLDYTLSGVATGTIAGNTNANFTGATFSVTFVENTSSIVPLGPGYNIYEGISGTFTEGSYSTTITGADLEVNGNANTGSGSYETVFLFNSDFGSSLGISDDATLLNYALASTINTGSVTSNLGAFQDVAGFSTTTGDTIEFTGVQSLDFAATQPTAATPEPSSLILLLSSVSGAGLLRRRFKNA